MEVEICVSLNVLSRIRNWQSLYGLKRGNFRSYRRFCIRKSNKIRKKHKMQFNQGKKFSREKFEKLLLERNVWDEKVNFQFLKKKKNLPDPEPLSEEQAKKIALDIGRTLLLNIERNYVVLSESKHSGGQIKKKIVKKKLRKALYYCEVLISQFSQHYNEKDKIELRVLKNIIEGSYNLEKRRFEEAKENLLQTIRTITQLQKRVSLIEKTHLQELIDNSKQNLRFCKFQLKEFGAGEEEILVGIENREEMQKILQLQSQRTETKTLKFFGESLDIEDKELMNCLNKIELLQKSYENSIGLQGEEELFWELMEALDEGIKKTKRSKAEAGNNLALSSIWDRVESFLEFQKMMYLLRRNLKIFDQYQLKNSTEKEMMVGKKDMKLDRRPQERARLIDNILECLRSVNELHAKLGKTLGLYKGFEACLRAIKCENVGFLFYKNEMYKEALSMQFQVEQLLNSVMDK